MGGNYPLALAGTAGVVTLVITVSTLLVASEERRATCRWAYRCPPR